MNDMQQKELIKYIFLKETMKQPFRQKCIEPILFLATRFGLPLNDLYFEFSDYSGLYIPNFTNYLIETFGENVKFFEKKEGNKKFYLFNFVKRERDIEILEEKIDKIEESEKVEVFLDFLNKILDDQDHFKILIGLVYKLFLLSSKIKGENCDEIETYLKNNFNIDNFDKINSIEKELTQILK